MGKLENYHFDSVCGLCAGPPRILGFGEGPI